MCGIAGIVDFAGGPVDSAVLVRACGLLRHRGPDDDGVWLDRRPGLTCGLAATRLCILDPTPAGHQPMTTPDGRYALVFNGLIYNFRELGDRLEAGGVRLRTRCDTEVVLHACIRWGPDAMTRFNGMWALAFFDRVEGRGFLARDPFGIKPLLWARHRERLCFASEMNTLCRLDDWPRDVDAAALRFYVQFGYVLHPNTVYQAAKRLTPGTYLPIDRSGVGTERRYDHPPGADASEPIDRRELPRRLRRTIFEAVARRRVADVPVGAFLSGGLDSSIIVAHLAEVSSHPVKTFSIGWVDAPTYDETSAARRVAERFGTEHHEWRCRSRDVLAALPGVLDALGEPFFDSSILPTALVCEFARRQVTVCLTGDAGDELFGGYWRYLAHDAHARYRRWPRLLRHRVIEPLARRASTAKSSWIANRVRQFRKLLRATDADPLGKHLAWSQILAPEAADVLRDGPMPTSALLDATRVWTFPGSHDDALNRIAAYDLRTSLPCDMLHKVDAASMGHSLEARVPFLDPDVVSLAMAIPSSLKINAGGGKAILREAYGELLPAEIVHRPKQGFEVPIGEFLRVELRDLFHDVVDRSTVDSLGLLDYAAIQRVYADHAARRGEHADLLFALLSLCWWRKRA